ncbi:MAG: signal peptidase I [Clostridia bacterium]
MRRRRRARPAWLEFLETLALAFVLALLVRSFVLESYQVSGFSMEPTLQNGERVLVNKFIFHFESPQPGEIIVFRSPVIPSQDWIKRVIAVPGETVGIRQGQVFINGRRVPEPFLKYTDPSSNYRTVKVPPGYLFVLGDNRPDSYDSRYFGFLKESLVRGEAFVVWWPPRAFRGL